MKREFLDYIEDIIEATTAALKFIKGIEYEGFKKDIKTSYVMRQYVLWKLSARQ